MKASIVLAGIALIIGAAGVLFVYSGIYNIAAIDEHTAPVYALLEASMRQSVRRHARDVAVPPLADPKLIARGRELYDAHCVRCHGAPGVAPEPFALGMTPVPANLAHTAREWLPAELFWVIRYGIKMTGMPAWDFRLAAADLWAIVAYLEVMPRESPPEYRAGARDANPLHAAHAQDGSTPSADAKRGKLALRQYGCATCHEIRGIVGAYAPVGPPLSNIAARSIVAGKLPNTVDNMIRWIRAPQDVNPQSAMPNLGVTERDASDIAAYLSSLK